MIYPNIWARGALFAFSGLDGECSFSGSMCGQLLAEKIGITFDRVGVELNLILKSVKNIEYKVVASDIIIGELNDSCEFGFVFTAENRVEGYCPQSCADVFCHADGFDCKKTKNGLILSSDKHKYFFEKKSEGDRILFSLTRSDIGTSPEKTDLSFDLVNEHCEKKLEFFDNLPSVKINDAGIEKALNKCFSVLKSQVYSPCGIFGGKWTTPDRIPHGKLWLWDSVFHSMGNFFISPVLACDSLLAVLDTQQSDGFIPHMASPDSVSSITQPPVLAWGFYEYYKKTKDKDFLSANFEKLEKYLLWNDNNRDKNKNNLYEWDVNPDNKHCRCDECGMDNSPRFDDFELMDAIDFSCFMANEMRMMAGISSILGLKEKKQYFIERYNQIGNAINESLFDPVDGRYYDRVVSSDELKKVSAVSSFLPLFAGICSEEQTEILVRDLTNPETFGTEFPVPTISKQDPTFGSDMWRGPVWVNYNYMIAQGLKDYGYEELSEKLITKTIDIVTQWYLRDGVVFEFYDCNNIYCPSELNRKGSPLRPFDNRVRYEAIRDYGWTSSLFVKMVMEKYN